MVFAPKLQWDTTTTKTGIYRRLLEATQSLKVYLFLHQNWDEWSVIGWQPGWGTVLCSAYGWSVEFSAKLVSVVTSKAFKMITRWTLKNVIYIQVLYRSHKPFWRDGKYFLVKFIPSIVKKIQGNNELVFYMTLKPQHIPLSKDKILLDKRVFQYFLKSNVIAAL